MLTTLAAATPEPQSCTHVKPGRAYSGDVIVIEAEASLDPRVLDEAIEVWSSCREYGLGFPYFVTDEGAGDEQIGRRIRIAARKLGPGQRCGSFHGSDIVLYHFARNARGKVVPCGSLSQNLAHELGHVLGLAHSPSTPRCKPRIMATLDAHNADRRRITSEECAAADRRWRTRGERAVRSLRGPP